MAATQGTLTATPLPVIANMAASSARGAWRSDRLFSSNAGCRASYGQHVEELAEPYEVAVVARMQL